MGRRAFQRLPIDVNESISSFLDTDKDFASFNAICRETHEAIQSYRCGAWRAQWKQEYDLPSPMTGLQIKAEYQRRRMLLYTKAFTLGRKPAEANCVGVLKQLIIDSFADPSKKQSNNMLRLLRFLKESNLFQTFNISLNIDKKKSTRDLQILHACLAHWHINSPKDVPHVPLYYYPISQVVAFAKTTDFPIFSGAIILEIPTILHFINYWRYHFNATLLARRDKNDKPEGWTRPVSNKVCLSRRWAGAQDDIHLMRDRVAECHAFDEYFELEDFEFDVGVSHQTATWPDIFEDNLKAIPSAPAPTPQRGTDYHVFNGSVTSSDDGEHLHDLRGILHDIPPQSGIPGFQRISFMKHGIGALVDDDGRPRLSVELDDECFCFQGVVLPGGHIILGRWWAPIDYFDGEEEYSYTGPFILWAKEE